MQRYGFFSFLQIFGALFLNKNPSQDLAPATDGIHFPPAYIILH
ncbi:hypothetical protein HMPREF9442_01024 [Paraprevotella xylaniphila YIT 11841]|uniref:Uncharacterized protein n=1 Tax=Paraprevotella xylaniphila YIT 11841 TaxID=762982 RepID=F3QS67_9BACT|nr:hypothetical protein HMPREF9442_01024 [Paraprevotella xylaniphila YIT 11841]